MNELATLDQYFGVWAIQEEPFHTAADLYSRPDFDLEVHFRTKGADARQQAAAYGSRGYATVGHDGSVAVVELHGSLMKFVPSVTAGTSTVQARRQIRAAVADKSIRSIVLLIDSPGGTVAGTADLAEEVAKADKQKPVHAYIEDLGASAAYWVASQARAIYANETALVGSIGTFMILNDSSKRAEKLGIQVHVVRAGEFKGSGTPGTEITDEQLAEWQGLVESINSHFLKAVRTGRKMSTARVKQLADGRVHVGEHAKALGLVDGIEQLDATIERLAGPATSSPPPIAAVTPQSQPQTNTTPASVSPATPVSPSPRRQSAMDTEAAIQVFSNAIKLQMLECGVDRKTATRTIARRHPEAHKAFLKATNPHMAAAIG